jgi:hypothetical protein
MTHADAFELIRASVSRGTATPSFGRFREEYIRTQSDHLLAAVIEPQLVHVVGETYSHGVLKQLRSENVLALAREEEKWLLYRPTKGEFCLAYGENSYELTIWGFSSVDALAEWLG